MRENITFKDKYVQPPYGGFEIKRHLFEGLPTDEIGDNLQCYWFEAIKNKGFLPIVHRSKSSRRSKT